MGPLGAGLGCCILGAGRPRVGENLERDNRGFGRNTLKATGARTARYTRLFGTVYKDNEKKLLNPEKQCKQDIHNDASSHIPE